jgi:hypothetical protein
MLMTSSRRDFSLTDLGKQGTEEKLFSSKLKKEFVEFSVCVMGVQIVEGCITVCGGFDGGGVLPACEVYNKGIPLFIYTVR